MVTNKEKINILINKYKKYVKTILNASPDEVEKLNSLSDTEAFNYLKKLEDGEEKEETADAENVDETNVEEANEVENVETSEENKDEE